MCVRAVHIEVVESLSSSSFISALRRFFSVSGTPKQIRSDRGTNFVGACKELKVDKPNKELNKYLQEQSRNAFGSSTHPTHPIWVGCGNASSMWHTAYWTVLANEIPSTDP